MPQPLLQRIAHHLHAHSWLLDRLLPHHCPICSIEIWQKGLCAACWQKLAFIHPPFCDSCGKPLHIYGLVPICGRCWMRRLNKDVSVQPSIMMIWHVRCYCRLNMVSLTFAPLLARLMMPTFEELITDDHLIIPIPLHLWRRLKRRYNQSTEIARHLCHLTDRQAQLSTTLLRRAHHTPSLARHNARKRQIILKDAFSTHLPAHIELTSRPILLIDDVMTTGATMQAAAQALRKAGAKQIDTLSFARVL